MCGLAFLHDPRAPDELAMLRMRNCLTAQHHRGPDDGRTEIVEGVLLGNRRLSIIHLSGARRYSAMAASACPAAYSP